MIIFPGIAPTGVKFDCDECSLTLLNRDLFIGHKVFVHGRHFCSKCFRLFQNGQEQSLHLVLEHGELPCDVCKSEGNAEKGTFTSFNDYDLHRWKDHEIFHCPFCSYIIPKESAVRTHLTGSHGYTGDNVNPESFLSRSFQVVVKQMRYHVTCGMCSVPVPRDKVLNHLIYIHKFTGGETVRLLQKCNFTLNPEVYMNLPVGEGLSEEKAEKFKFSKTTCIKEENIHDRPKNRNPGWWKNSEPCPIEGCDKRCSIMHVTLDHPGQVYCEGCHCFFDSLTAKMDHNPIKHGNNKTCRLCEKVFEKNSQLWTHTFEEHRQFSCPLCSSDAKLLPDLKSFRNHLKSKHSVHNKFFRPKDEAAIRSRLIEYPFFNLIAEKRLAQCNLCEKRHIPTSSRNIFRIHMIKFHNFTTVRAFSFYDGKDQWCVATSEMLPIPQRVASVEITPDLSYLGKQKETTNLELKKEIIIEDNHSPMELSVENVKDVTVKADKVELEEEIQVSFKCFICFENGIEKIFDAKEELVKHADEEHRNNVPDEGQQAQENNKENVESSTTAVPYKCEFCAKGFHFLSALNGHRSKAHKVSGGDNLKCGLCDTVTANKSSMKRHMIKAHPEAAGNSDFGLLCK